MFDIGGLELLVIAVVLIVVVGPKDLPRMLRTFGRVSGQMRRMAGDFRKQFDEALKEAELDELRDVARDVKSLDPRTDIRKAMNPVRAVGDEIRSSLKAATAAPAPIVPSADAPATPVAPPRTMSSNPAGAAMSGPDAASPAEPVAASPAPHLNGSTPAPVAAPSRDTAGVAS